MMMRPFDFSRLFSVRRSAREQNSFEILNFTVASLVLFQSSNTKRQDVSNCHFCTVCNNPTRLTVTSFGLQRPWICYPASITALTFQFSNSCVHSSPSMLISLVSLPHTITSVSQTVLLTIFSILSRFCG